MKRPTMLLRQLLLNIACLTSTAIERDLQVIEDRVKNEGMSFLTITLPTLDDALLRGLTEGRLSPHMFPGFKPWKRGGSLPAFMVGLFKRVFHTDGLLMDEPCITSIDMIRQVARLFKKVELPCTDTRVKQAFERYKSNEQELYEHSYSCPSSDPLWIAVSGYLWSDLEFRASEIYCSPGIFGSGATAERYRLHERYDVRQWPTRGETNFPASYHTSYREDDREKFDSLEWLSGKEERPVRVVTVPKTLKTPRIIAVEPSYMMLRQQSVWRFLHNYLEGPKFPFRSIRFTSQSVNRELACSGSVDGDLSTIDLSDASDRVSSRLVATTFRSCPTFLRMIFGARTRQAELPDGSFLNLRKFASMGSALCFPIESMVFFTAVLVSMCRQAGKRPSRSVLQRLAKDIAIYGDDIIVPTQMAAGVMSYLEALGLKVNKTKSFTSGFFRESCGGDYYKGELITPVYVRRLEGSSKRLDATDVAAYISLSNQFYMKGLWHVSQYIRDYLNSRLRKRISRTTNAVGGLTYTSVIYTDICGWDVDSQQFCVRAITTESKRRDDVISNLSGVMYYSFQRKETPCTLGALHAHPVHSLQRVERAEEPSELLLPYMEQSFCEPELLLQPAELPSIWEHEEAKEGVGSVQPTSPSSVDVYRRSFGLLGGRPCGPSRLHQSDDSMDPRSGRSYDGTSVRPYTLSTKCRLIPTRVGQTW